MKDKTDKLVIFDLDGTLINTAPDLANCINLVMHDLNLPEQSLEKVISLIGNGLHKLLEDVLAEALGKKPNKKIVEKGYNLFIKYYKNNLTNKSHVYPSVLKNLDYFKSINIKLACVTNKLESFTQPLLKHFKIHKYFDLVLSGDSLAKKKPDPMPLECACRLLNVSAKNSMMVGDSENDVLAAKSAGINSVYVTYGYTQVNEILKLNPDIILDTFLQLREHV